MTARERAMLDRRTALKGAAAATGLLVCEAVAKPVTDVLVPRLGCGCPRIHKLAYGHTCTIHDERGKRWDAYTIEEIVCDYPGLEIEAQTADTEWCCYCSRHEKQHSMMPVGTRCIWQRVSSMYDEWECQCVEAFREDWLNTVTVDWIAMAEEDEATEGS